MTEKVTSYFNEPQKVLVLADGTTVSRWDDRFYHEETTEKPFPERKFRLPEGAVEKDLSAEEARTVGIGPQTLSKAATDYYGEGVIERDGRFYNRTNPNKKWDWWVRGGRYRGRLIPLINSGNTFSGEPGAFDNKPLNVQGVDSCQMSNLNLSLMRENAAKRAGDLYDKVAAVIGGRSFLSWDEALAKNNGDVNAARERYWEQPAVKDLRAATDAIGYIEAPEDFRVSREEYLENARKDALSAYAVLKDGKWYERGEMGWFGIAHNEKDEGAWRNELSKLLDELSPSTWVTIVDCHI